MGIPSIESKLLLRTTLAFAAADYMEQPARRRYDRSIMSRRFLAVVVLSILFPTLALARDQDARAKVSAAMNLSALQPGSKAVAAVVIDIAPGFHAQSHQPLEKFLIPFEV